MATNKSTVKDSFHFAEEIVDEQSNFFMGSLDVDSQFTNIPLEETTEICKYELFKESEIAKSLTHLFPMHFSLPPENRKPSRFSDVFKGERVH